MLNKKSIVLSGMKDKAQKAVLTLEEDGVGIKGLLRLYNFSREPNGICSLGLNVDKKVYKAGLSFKSRMLYEFFLSLEKIPAKFSCAIVNFQNAVPTPILFGASEGANDEIYASIISEISEDKSAENVKNVLDKYDVDFADEEKKEIEQQIDKTVCQDCANCIYKKYFFEQQEEKGENQPVVQNVETILQETKEPEETDVAEEDEEEEELFFDRLKPQIDKLFENNPIEENLQSLIPSSKWVKVEYQDDGDFYVFGLLYDEDGNVKYVCYGVPAVFENEPPKELSGYPIWLALDQNKQDGFGYWLTYQDAASGEPIKAFLD